MHEPRRRLRILTWRVHGNYLYYLSLGLCRLSRL